MYKLQFVDVKFIIPSSINTNYIRIPTTQNFYFSFITIVNTKIAQYYHW